MRLSRIQFRLALALAVAVAPGVSVAQVSQAPTPGEVAEARQRFQRGIELADEANYPGAMAEFERAYQLTHNPLVLYNISATHEAVGHHVEAYDAMVRYRDTAPPDVVASRRAEVEAALARLRQRIGTVVVGVEAPGLQVRIDGLPRPLPEARVGARVDAGRHRVLLIAPNFQSRETEVDVAGGASVTVAEPLAPAQSSIAVEANIPGAEILIDGRPIARTPEPSPMGVAEGPHHVVVRRQGYTTYETDVNSIGSGARVRAQLVWQEPVSSADGARLVVHASETGLVGMIDGRRVAVDGTELVPPGPHHLRVERTDFLPDERDIDLPPARETRVEVLLLPTPSYRDSYLSHARGVRTTGWIVTAAGLAVAAGAAAWLVTNENAIQANQQQFDLLSQRFTSSHGTGGVALQTQLTSFQNLLDTEQQYRIASAAIAGAGLVAAVVGVVILATAPSSGRFEQATAAPPVRLRGGLGGASLELDF